MTGPTPEPEDQGVGASIDRREDRPLITESAEYTDDIHRPGALHAAVVRSQYAHARIESVDVTDAMAHEDVEAAFTGADLAAAEVPGDVPAWFSAPGPEDGDVYAHNRPSKTPRRPAIAAETVRHAGEPVAVVLAEDRYAASEAAGLVDVEYDRRDGVVNPVEAVEASAIQIHDEAPNNVAIDWSVGDAERTDAAFERAAHTVEYSLRSQRLIPNAMEPRAVLSESDSGREKLTVEMSTQVPHHVQQFLSDSLDIPENRIHVRAPSVGGGFGTKSKFYPAEIITAWCSIELGQPVKWVASRSESYLTGIHGREHDTTAELALEEDGQITGLRVETYANVGAYVSKVTPRIISGAYGNMLSGSYEIPAIDCRVIGAFTNTAPIDAYRGAGRPQATYVVERGMDLSARELDLDPVEIRRRNLIGADDFPFETAAGATYDSGEYERAMERALETADYDPLRERQRRLRDEGRYLGVGIANFVEETGIPVTESSQVTVHRGGTVTARVGTAEHGQGHETTFAQVLADELGVPYGDIEIEEGDTEVISEGTGTFASRSALAGGNSLRESARTVIEKARTVAADELEAAEGDVVFADGEFRISGAPDRSLSIQEVADVAYATGLSEDVDPGLAAETQYTPEETYAFGTHVAVVEVDPDAGDVEIERYVAVHDCGVQINPTIVEGQIHGGVAQGIGQALYEEAVYDDTGNLLSGSMQDYAVPKAQDIPEMDVEFTVTPAPGNPLGVKGIGENGTLGPPAAIVNAVTDALSPFGVRHVETPVTAETVWEAVDR